MIPDFGYFTLEFKQPALWESPPLFLCTLGPWCPNKLQGDLVQDVLLGCSWVHWLQPQAFSWWSEGCGNPRFLGIFSHLTLSSLLFKHLRFGSPSWWGGQWPSSGQTICVSDCNIWSGFYRFQGRTPRITSSNHSARVHPSDLWSEEGASWLLLSCQTPIKFCLEKVPVVPKPSCAVGCWWCGQCFPKHSWRTPRLWATLWPLCVSMRRIFPWSTLPQSPVLVPSCSWNFLHLPTAAGAQSEWPLALSSSNCSGWLDMQRQEESWWTQTSFIWGWWRIWGLRNNQWNRIISSLVQMCLRLATAPPLSFWGRSFDLMDLIPAQICTTSWEAWFQMESDNMLKHLKAEQKNWTWMAEVCVTVTGLNTYAHLIFHLGKILNFWVWLLLNYSVSCTGSFYLDMRKTFSFLIKGSW